MIMLLQPIPVMMELESHTAYGMCKDDIQQASRTTEGGKPSFSLAFTFLAHPSVPTSTAIMQLQIEMSVDAHTPVSFI